MTWELLIANAVPAIEAAVSAGLVRNVFGWGYNSFKDGKIQAYEIQQLGGTLVKYFGFISLFAIGLPLEQALALTVGIDVVGSEAKKLKK